MYELHRSRLLIARSPGRRGTSLASLVGFSEMLLGHMPQDFNSIAVR